MQLNVRSGPAHVLTSGMVTSFFGHALSWRLDLPDAAHMYVEMVFEDDDDHPELAVRTEPLAAGIRLRLLNFRDASGRGSADPVLLGDMGPHLLFLHFRAFRHGNSRDHTVHYTFYRATKQSLGWRPDAPPAEDS